MDHWSTQPAIGSGFRHCRWGRTGAGRIGEWTRGSGGELRGLGEVGEGRGRGEADCGGWRGKAVDCAKSGEGPEAGRVPSGRCSGAFQNGSPEECGVTGKSPSRSGRGCGRDDDGWSVWGGGRRGDMRWKPARAGSDFDGRGLSQLHGVRRAAKWKPAQPSEAGSGVEVTGVQRLERRKRGAMAGSHCDPDDRRTGGWASRNGKDWADAERDWAVSNAAGRVVAMAGAVQVAPGGRRGTGG